MHYVEAAGTKWNLLPFRPGLVVAKTAALGRVMCQGKVVRDCATRVIAFASSRRWQAAESAFSSG
jgi:hypothetical protein